MKRIAYLSMFAGLLLTGCIEGDYGIKPSDPQSWEQEDPIVLPEQGVVRSVAPIDLAAIETDSVAVAEYTPSEFAEGILDLAVVVNDKYTFEVEPDMKIAVEDLQKMVINEYGHRPQERTFEAQVVANVIVDGQASLLSPVGFELKLTPEAPFIDSAYYIIGNMNEWNIENAMQFKFKHSGKDVYDDPVFSIVVDVPENCYWKIVPQSNLDKGEAWDQAGVLGVEVNGDEAMNGKLVSENVNAAKIVKAGNYSIAINILDYTYSITPMATEYYLVGALNKWNTKPEGKYCILYPTSESVFSYTTKWEGDYNFKIFPGSAYGVWDEAMGTAIDGDDSPEGTIVPGNLGAIKVPTKDEYYTVTFDFGAMKYASVKLENQTPQEYESVSLIGGFNEWKADADLIQKTPHNWVLNDLDIASDCELKFRANHDWLVMNWGAKVNIAEISYGLGIKDGDNIKIPAGVYDVYLNDITGNFIFVKK